MARGGLAREAGARRGLLRGDEAAVAGRGVALEALRVERRIAQPVEEDARDDGALVVDGGLLLDHRRQRHHVAHAERRPRSSRRSGSTERACERDVPAAVELALHAPHDVARVAVEGADRRWPGRGSPRRCRPTARARGAGAASVVASRNSRSGHDVLVLEPARHVEARPAFGERHAHAAAARRGARGAP